MKYIILLSIIFFITVKTVFSQQTSTDLTCIYDENYIPSWQFFSILANINDDSLFIKLQDELGVYPQLETYIITINITDSNPLNKYLYIGESDNPIVRASWDSLPVELRNAIKMWSKNKQNLNTEKNHFGSVFSDVIEQILKEKIVILSPP